jgi:hypothetical protein
MGFVDDDEIGHLGDFTPDDRLDRNDLDLQIRIHSLVARLNNPVLDPVRVESSGALGNELASMRYEPDTFPARYSRPDDLGGNRRFAGACRRHEYDSTLATTKRRAKLLDRACLVRSKHGDRVDRCYIACQGRDQSARDRGAERQPGSPENITAAACRVHDTAKSIQTR